MKDIIIVGGGYTGIAIKGYLKSKNIKIYEASNKIGGILKDLQISNNFFFQSCQYFNSNSFSTNKLELTDDFYKFDHNYGSYTDIFGKKIICKNFAGPVYPGSINIKPIKKKNFKSLKDRIKIYPEEISFFLSQWFKKIGVNIEEAHHTAGTGFQASRIYCVDMKEKMKLIKKSSNIADQLYGLPRNNINLNKLQSLLPASGFNKYFEHLENIWKENIKLKAICNPIKFNNKVYLNYGDKSECPNMLLWTANPTPLFKKIFDVKLDSNKHHAETLFGFLEKKITTPFYIQVFSQYSNILRIYIYNINNRGCYTIEKAFDDTDDRTVVTQAQKIINNFFSVKLIKNLARKRSLRYFVYTVRDYELINHYRKNNNIDNLIFTNFLSYGRDDKVKSIIQKMKTLTKYEKEII